MIYPVAALFAFTALAHAADLNCPALYKHSNGADYVDAGYADSYRGWYDISGCGTCTSYCRWVGNSGSGGSPDARIVSDSSWWACTTPENYYLSIAESAQQYAAVSNWAEARCGTGQADGKKLASAYSKNYYQAHAVNDYEGSGLDLLVISRTPLGSTLPVPELVQISTACPGKEPKTRLYSFKPDWCNKGGQPWLYKKECISPSTGIITLPLPDDDAWCNTQYDGKRVDGCMYRAGTPSSEGCEFELTTVLPDGREFRHERFSSAAGYDRVGCSAPSGDLGSLFPEVDSCAWNLEDGTYTAQTGAKLIAYTPACDGGSPSAGSGLVMPGFVHPTVIPLAQLQVNTNKPPPYGYKAKSGSGPCDCGNSGGGGGLSSCGTLCCAHSPYTGTTPESSFSDYYARNVDQLCWERDPTIN